VNGPPVRQLSVGHYEAQPREDLLQRAQIGGVRVVNRACVGLPPGADVDRATLAKLLATWSISRYELQPDRIVFYLWSWKAEGSRFSFRFTPRYAIRAKAAPAMLFDVAPVV